MAIPLDFMYAGVLAVCLGLGIVGLASVLLTRVTPVLSFLHRDVGDSRRRCRYCFLGQAELYEERTTVEDNDLVEVKCYVCRSCGLPHWSVQRSPVLKKAA